jgi:hypothetical protein
MDGVEELQRVLAFLYPFNIHFLPLSLGFLLLAKSSGCG